MTSPERETKASPPDFSLLLSRLEARIIKGENRGPAERALGNERVWKRLGLDLQLRWAGLAQMSGQVETALEVLAHINNVHPQAVEAWSRRLDLLAILDRREELARVLALCRQGIGEEVYRGWISRIEATDNARKEEDMDGVSSPFDTLHMRQEALLHYMDLFSGREDCFARQWAERAEGKQGYVPVRRPMEPADVEEHLGGRKTYGIYLLRSDATVKAAVIDMDVAPQFRKPGLKAEERRILKREYAYVVSRVMEESQSLGVKTLLEFSGGKGFHFWYCFSTPMEAGSAKRMLERVTGGLEKDVTAFHLEIFPKQDHLSGKGLGNLVKLPLGVHRMTGKQSYFPGCSDRSMDRQLAYLKGFQGGDPEEARAVSMAAEREEVVVRPRIRQWSRSFPELARLETCCPPLGQVIAASRAGREIPLREEKVLFQTLGFLPTAKSLLHQIMSSSPDYNPHMVDYRLSRVSGKPLGCKRIHSLLGFSGDLCPFQGSFDYPHPLLHLDTWDRQEEGRSEKVVNLTSALESLKTAILQVERFMK